jgi:Fe-S cluster assembly protein SufD
VHAFSADAARSLAGDDPRQGADRSAAAERAAGMVWPSATEEIWRYSRIGDLNIDDFTPAPTTTTVDAPGQESAFVTSAPGSGGPVAALVDGPAPDVFAELNAAFAAPVQITVPAGAYAAQPIVVTHHVDTDGSAVFPRLLVDAGEDCEVTVVERFVGSGRALVAPVVHLRAGRAARLRYVAVNELSVDAWQIGHQMAVGDADSSTTVATVAFGGHYARVRTEVRLAGRGGNTKQIALYFAGGDQMHDFRTIQDHDAPHTNSDLLFKGVVQGSAQSVYTGLIRVREHARGTAAFQTNRNLTLGEHAWASSVPNLDIRTNDVKCSHASTVGPIDPEQRFYLESRGVPTNIADRLIVLGFFDEVLDQLPAPALVAPLRARVAGKLDVGRLVVDAA